MSPVYEFKLTESDGSHVEVMTTDVTLTGVVETFRRFLLAAGFHHESVAAAFGEGEI